MKINNKILLFGILIILITHIGLVLAQEEVILSLEEIEVIGSLDTIDPPYYDKETGTYYIYIKDKRGLKDSEKIIIGDLVLENIVPPYETEHRAYVRLNSAGEILELDVTINEEGWIGNIDGNKIEVLPNSKEPRVIYNKEKNSLELPEGSKLNDVSNEELLVKGIDLNLLDEVLFDGEGTVSIDSDGFLIKQGKVVYGGLEIAVDEKSGDVLIVKDSSSNYQGNRIEKIPGVSSLVGDGLKMTSAETGSLNVKFRKNNEFIKMGEENNGKLNMQIRNGDEIEITTIVGASEIHHTKSKSGKGKTNIQNNGFDIIFKGEAMLANRNTELDVQDILSENYAIVPCKVVSDVDQMWDRETGEGKVLEIYGDKDASLKKVITTYNRDGSKNFIEKAVGSYDSSFINFTKKGFKHKDFYEVAEALTKENSIKRSNEIFNSKLPDVVRGASENGFSKDQTVNLIIKTIDLAGKDSSDAFLFMNRPLSFADGRMTPNEFTIFSLELTKEALAEGDLSLLNPSYGILRESLDKGFDLDPTLNFISESIHAEGINMHDKKQELLLKTSLREYDGTNFQNIAQGITIANKYAIRSDIIELFESDLRYSEIKNEEDLAKQFALILNEYYAGNDFSYSLVLGRQINEFHDAEHTAEDLIRKTIIANLDDKSKYYLIANANSDKDLYTSTLKLIVESFPEDFIDNLDQIDPEKKHKFKFVMYLAKNAYLDDLVENDAEYFREAITEALNVDDDEKFEINAAFMAETLSEYYKDPKYEEEKKYFEDLLAEMMKGKESFSLDKKCALAYIMKLNKNPGENFKEILSGKEKFPEIDKVMLLPERRKDVVKFKQYYMSDEKWFDEAMNVYGKLGYTFIGETTNPDTGRPIRILSRNNGKEILELESLSTKKDEEANNHKTFIADLEDPKIGGIVVSCHSYNHEKVVPPDYESDSSKIVLFGECGGASKLPVILTRFENVFGWGWEQIGEGKKNAEIVSHMSSWLAAGNREVKGLTPEGLDYTTLVGADDPMPGLYRYKKKCKEELV